MVIIKDALFPDHDAIAKLHAENWKQHYRGILSDSYLDREVEMDRAEIWHQRFATPSANQRVMVAVHCDYIVGFSCLFLDDDLKFGSLLDNLHVSTPYQNTGVGKLLMKECVKKIHERAEIKKMYLWAYELNENARKVYERLGGICYETVNSTSEDGMGRRVCRYIWDDLSVF